MTSVPPLELGTRMVWARRGVVEVARIAQAAGESFFIVEPIGWTGEAGWIAPTAIKLHLRPLASPAVCERWLAQLRAQPAPRTPATSTRTRTIHELAIDFGSPAQQVEALTALYAEVPLPDHDGLIEKLERLVVVQVACVLGLDIEALRAELHDRHRFGPTAMSRVGRAEPAAEEPFAVFTVESELHVTDLDTTSVRVPAVRDTWRAIERSCETAWIVVADSYRERFLRASDGALGTPRVIARVEGNVYPFAVLDAAVPLDPLLTEAIDGCHATDLFGHGAASFYRRPLLVTAWEDAGACVALEIRFETKDDDIEEREDEEEDDELEEEEEDDGDLLDFPQRGQHVLQLRHGVVHVEDVFWEEARGAVVRTRDVDGDEVAEHKAHAIDRVLRPLIDRDAAIAAQERIATPRRPRPPGDAVARERHYRSFFERGTFEEQVDALGHLYAESVPPTRAELETIERYERLILGEIAVARGTSLPAEVARMRARSARFTPEARSADPADATASLGPTLPDGYRWITTFHVDHALQLTDLTNTTHSLPAAPGAWHAAWEDDALVVVADQLRADLAGQLSAPHRTISVAGPRDFPLAVVDAQALQSSVVSNAVIEGMDVDVMGRGVAWLPKLAAVEVQVWTRDGICVALRLS